MKVMKAWCMGAYHGLICLIALSPFIVLLVVCVLAIFSTIGCQAERPEVVAMRSWADTSLFVGKSWTTPPASEYWAHIESTMEYEKYMVYTFKYPSRFFITVNKGGTIVSVWSSP